MAKFVKKPVVVEATQWFCVGDVANVVRRLTAWVGEEDVLCKHCGGHLRHHGYVETLEGGYIVCPGDWIITGVKGEHYPCKPDIFEMTYEPVEETNG